MFHFTLSQTDQLADMICHLDYAHLFFFLPLQVSNAIKFSPRGRELRVVLEFCEVQIDPSLLALGLTGTAGGANNGGSDSTIPAAFAAANLAGRSIGELVARVTVKDEGAGIPIEHRENLFKVRAKPHQS